MNRYIIIIIVIIINLNLDIRTIFFLVKKTIINFN